MANSSKRGGPGDKLETLGTVLQTATKIVAEVASDPLFTRLVQVFAHMPPEDREGILAVLEREVDLRLLSEATSEGLTGAQLARPNPHARLYLRVFEPEEDLTSVTRDEMMRSTVRAAGRMRRLLEASGQGGFELSPLVEEVLQKLEPADRRAVAWTLRWLLERVEDTQGDSGGG